MYCVCFNKYKCRPYILCKFYFVTPRLFHKVVAETLSPCAIFSIKTYIKKLLLVKLIYSECLKSQMKLNFIKKKSLCIPSRFMSVPTFLFISLKSRQVHLIIRRKIQGRAYFLLYRSIIEDNPAAFNREHIVRNKNKAREWPWIINTVSAQAELFARTFLERNCWSKARRNPLLCRHPTELKSVSRCTYVIATSCVLW
jgi:hypothetical protein